VKDQFIKALKVMLVIVIILTVIGLIFGATLLLGFPWWLGFFFLFGFIGFWLGFVYLRKRWIKYREERFVSQVIEQDSAAIQHMGDTEESSRSKELQTRWKEAIDTLKHSHLKKHGNPLYVLPWYMVIGESGSGKTTAIKSARLSSPFAEVMHAAGISGTRNCDWWFFEQAILIDTAGRYTIPINEVPDKDEWHHFLVLLTKFRKREPLNGLVITLAVDKLLDSAPENLEQDGRNIRLRTDELMRVLGAKFPVYILVTKCDLIQGMNQFCNHLPEKSLNQAMGVINPKSTASISAFLGPAFHTVGERLKDIRLRLFHKLSQPIGSKKTDRDLDPELFLFPEEFERLKPGLEAFFKGAFLENPYQETPILRGIFFSSGRQEGTPYSHFLKELGLIEAREVLPGTGKGLFLHDFFSGILPKDRTLFVPTQRALNWNRITRHLGLTAWIAIGIALCGILSYSFAKNLKTLRDISRDLSNPPVLQGEILTDVSIMDRFRQSIENAHAQNRNWWIPRLGLHESRNVETELKEKFCKQFKTGFLIKFDRQIADRVGMFSNRTSDEENGYHISHLVRRINLLRACLKNEPLEKLQEMPQPSYEPVATVAAQRLVPELRQRFEALYVSYLAWQPDKTILNEEMNQLHTWLKHALMVEGADLKWLVTWVNQNPNLEKINLEDFWGTESTNAAQVFIEPAFTLKGKEEIDSFLKEIEGALYEPLILADRKKAFYDGYRNSYYKAWENFVIAFPQGINLLQNKKDTWQQIAMKMATDQGPYFMLLKTMPEHLKVFDDSSQNNSLTPEWIKVVFKYENARLNAAIQENLLKAGALGKTVQKGKEIIGKIDKEKQKSLAALETAGKSLLDYQNALAQIMTAAKSRATVFQMLTDTFNQDAATGESPFFKAHNGINKVKNSLTGTSAEQKIFWQLVTGPLDFYWSYFSKETACHLQLMWEKDVLVEAQGPANQMNLNKVILGEEGSALKFVKGPAAPFIGTDPGRGFYAKNNLGKFIAFEGGFMSFLTQGARARAGAPLKENYSVTVTPLPTSANPNALAQPHAVNLKLQCATETQQVINRNYPLKKTIAWSPQNCGDVLFEIEISNLVCTRKYTNPMAFAKFLGDFARGERIFRAEDFPEQALALKNLNVKTIQVRYEFSGHQPILELSRSTPEKVPWIIAKCWE